MSNLITRTLILTKALKLFAYKGYENASLDSIAKKVNLTKGAIYWNFKNKEDLFYTLFESESKKYFDYIKIKTANIQNPIILLETLLRENCRYYLNNPEFCKISHMVLSNQILKKSEKIRMLTSQMENDFFQLLFSTFKEGIEKKIFIAEPIENLISTFGVLVDGIMLQIIFDQPRETIEKTMEVSWTIFIKGIKNTADKPNFISLAFQPELK